MRRPPGMRLLCALVSALLWVAACRFGGGSEDSNDLQVTGFLFERDGTPARNARVVLFRSQELEVPAESTTTDRSGYFRFQPVPRGNYSLLGGIESGAAAIFIPLLEVEGDSHLQLPPLKLERVAILQGRLEGNWKQARAVLDSTPYRTDVDASGRFVFPSLAPGRYLLRILVAPGEGPEREAAQMRVTVAAGDSLTLPPVSVRLATEWSHRGRLQVEMSDLGGNRLEGFPLLLRLEGDAFPAGADPGGRDIRFARLDGTLQAHEIESWDPTARKAAIWVRADTLTQGTSLWMHWGNAAAPLSEGGVFDSSAHAGAWHLGENPAGPAPQSRDVSGRLNHATAQGAVLPTPAEGIAGNGLAFIGGDQYLSSAMPQIHPDDFTVSLWFRAQTPGGKLAGLESKATGTSDYFDRQLWLDSSGRVCFGVFSPAPAVITPADSPYVRAVPGSPSDPPGRLNMQRILTSASTYLDGGWHHLAATLSTQGQFLYVDGIQAAANPSCTSGAGFTGYWRFAGGALRTWVGAPAKEYFHGALDEISVSRSRDADWIRAAFLTQKPGTRGLLFTTEY
jgi:hypothetical protein